MHQHQEKTLKPAILGGTPAFKKRLFLASPQIPSFQSMESSLKDIFDHEKKLTKGKYLGMLEKKVANYIGVKHCIGVSSCTSALMLVMKVLGLSGEVILPSFTFMATGQALLWQGTIKPVFADINPHTLNVSVDHVKKLITPNTSAIVGVHLYGNPCEIEELEALCKERGIKLLFDSAHAFGAMYNGKKIGQFGDAECFSCTPTKILIAGEGGLITTNSDSLAEKLVQAREYGNNGYYDSILLGMNARLSEIHASIALESLKNVDTVILERNKKAKFLQRLLKEIPGIRFPVIEEENLSTYKDFTIIVEEPFGLSRDQLVKCLDAENTETRNYFDPPLHGQTLYQNIDHQSLIETDKLSKQVVSLPLAVEYPEETFEKMAFVLKTIHENAAKIL